MKKIVYPEASRVKVPKEISDALVEFKESSQWAAIKVLMECYREYKKERAYKLLETDENFAIKHTRETAVMDGINFLIAFVEQEAGRRESKDGH